MNSLAHVFTILLLAAAAGCASVSGPVTGSAISSGIQVQSGYDGCPGCDKVKTYASPPLAVSNVQHRGDEGQGWINAKVSLVATNNTGNNVPRYELLASFVNNGDFAKEGDLSLAGFRLSTLGPRLNFSCSSNIGSGCSWSQAYAIDTTVVEDAIESGEGLSLSISATVRVMVRGNDGYAPTAGLRLVRAEQQAKIPAQALAAFVAGLKERGAFVPTSYRETDQRQADLIGTNWQERERPLKQSTGTQVCRKAGAFTEIGFVEDAASGKLKIRIVDSVMPGTTARASNFYGRTMWDEPDNWFLCGRG